MQNFVVTIKLDDWVTIIMAIVDSYIAELKVSVSLQSQVLKQFKIFLEVLRGMLFDFGFFCGKVVIILILYYEKVTLNTSPSCNFYQYTGMYIKLFVNKYVT